jgi:hypothetical protein
VVRTTSAVIKPRKGYESRALLQSRLSPSPLRRARRATVEVTSVTCSPRHFELAKKSWRKSLACAGRAGVSQPQIKLTFPFQITPPNFTPPPSYGTLLNYNFVLVPNRSQPSQTDHCLVIYSACTMDKAEPNNAALYDARRRQQGSSSQVLDNIVSGSNCASSCPQSRRHSLTHIM